MRTREANRAFSWRTNKNVLNVSLSAVLAAMGAALILGAGVEVLQEIVLPLEPDLLILPLKWGRSSTGMRALLGCTGFLACHLIEGHLQMARWQRYLYASAFVILLFALLIQWFGVSGATDWRS